MVQTGCSTDFSSSGALMLLLVLSNENVLRLPGFMLGLSLSLAAFVVRLSGVIGWWTTAFCVTLTGLVPETMGGVREKALSFVPAVFAAPFKGALFPGVPLVALSTVAGFAEGALISWSTGIGASGQLLLLGLIDEWSEQSESVPQLLPLGLSVISSTSDAQLIQSMTRSN